MVKVVYSTQYFQSNEVDLLCRLLADDHTSGVYLKPDFWPQPCELQGSSRVQ